jgi:hypothetical protein
VLQEKDILACDGDLVTFRYRNGKTHRTGTRTLPGTTFLWLLLQHVLPKGFRRARHFGFLHPNSKRLIQLLHRLIKSDLRPLQSPVTSRPTLQCPSCGGPMIIVRTRIWPPLARPAPTDTLEVALAL